MTNLPKGQCMSRGPCGTFGLLPAATTMSQTLIQSPTPIPGPSNTPEVINVDEYTVGGGPDNDDDIQFLHYVPARRSQEPIVIDDSDDDVEIIAGPSQPVVGGVPAADRRRTYLLDPYFSHR